MDLLHAVWKSLVAVLFLFAMTKLIGPRQVSQMSMFDYICGISIGSIAAEAAVVPVAEIGVPLIAMAVFGVVSALLAFFTCKSLWLRRFLTGKPTVLFANNTLYEKNLLRSKMDVNEFLTQCRVCGYFDLSQIHTVFLEPNGQVSILPKSLHRPVTPEDMQQHPAEERPCIDLILDGTLLAENLQLSGKNDVWLANELAAQHQKQKDVLLAYCDADDKLQVYAKNEKGSS